MIRNRSGFLCLTAPLLCLCVSTASAGAIDDGNQGLDALNKGQYDTAVRYFSKALASGQLKLDDQEFAYLNRAKAYLSEGDRAAGLADLRRALQLRPDDREAGTLLQETTSGGQRSNAARNPSASAALARWGLFQTIADRLWMRNVKGRTVYEKIQWTSDHGSILDIELYSSGQRITTRIVYEPGAGLVFGEVVGHTVFYGTIDAGSNKLVASGVVKGVPVRSTLTMRDENTIDMVTEAYKGGAWTEIERDISTSVSPEQVQAVSWARRLLQ